MFEFADEYYCRELIVSRLDTEASVDPQKIHIPESHSEISKAKTRFLGRIKKCECGEVGYPRHVKGERMWVEHMGGVQVQYLDYTREKPLCDTCHKKDADWQMNAEIANSETE